MKLKKIVVRTTFNTSGEHITRYGTFEISEKACFRLFRDDTDKILDFFNIENIANWEADNYKDREIYNVGHDYEMVFIDDYDDINSVNTIEGKAWSKIKAEEVGDREVLYKAITSGLDAIKNRLKYELLQSDTGGL